MSEKIFIILNEDRPQHWTPSKEAAFAVVDEFNARSNAHTWWVKEIERLPKWREEQ